MATIASKGKAPVPKSMAIPEAPVAAYQKEAAEEALQRAMDVIGPLDDLVSRLPAMKKYVEDRVKSRPALRNVPLTKTNLGVIGFSVDGKAGEVKLIQWTSQYLFKIEYVHATDWTPGYAKEDPDYCGAYPSGMHAVDDGRLPTLALPKEFEVYAPSQSKLSDAGLATIEARLEYGDFAIARHDIALLLQEIRAEREASKRRGRVKLAPAPGSITEIDCVFISGPTSAFLDWKKVDAEACQIGLPISIRVRFLEGGHFQGAFYGKYVA